MVIDKKGKEVFKLTKYILFVFGLSVMFLTDFKDSNIIVQILAYLSVCGGFGQMVGKAMKGGEKA